MQDNIFTGALPDDFAALTALERIYMERNNLDRDINPDHTVLLSPTLQNRYTTLINAGKNINIDDQ